MVALVINTMALIGEAAALLVRHGALFRDADFRYDVPEGALSEAGW